MPTQKSLRENLSTIQIPKWLPRQKFIGSTRLSTAPAMKPKPLLSLALVLSSGGHKENGLDQRRLALIEPVHGGI